MRAFLNEHGLNNLDPLTTQQPKQMNSNNNNNSDFCEDGIMYDDFFDEDVPYVDHTDIVVDDNDEDLQAVWDVEASIDSPSIL